jgi:hypothetical protein
VSNDNFGHSAFMALIVGRAADISASIGDGTAKVLPTDPGLAATL